ncbi:DUF6023 family protein [Actinoplanes aureus]|uniref:Uncharacterized protein n=1 Tax=Actinoplanes aureus TaxID=2792083 RepID=A0A931CF27_9ACTN|nr:DUF6023 family protein [Actinoplanes aureus]MBG0568944.1 hypothetical protein [Actinoplanes aureus]
MSGERGRDAVLHLSAAFLLVAGATWWWRAAPQQTTDPRLLHWRLSTEQLLPDTGDQETASTLALGAGTGHEEEVPGLDTGSYLVSVVCAGDDGSRIRVSLGSGYQSGRGVPCSGARTPEMFSVGLSGDLLLRVNVEEAGPVVFRYTLQRMER